MRKNQEKKLEILREKREIALQKKAKIEKNIQEYDRQIKEIEQEKLVSEAKEIMEVIQESGVSLEDVKQMLSSTKKTQ